MMENGNKKLVCETYINYLYYLVDIYRYYSMHIQKRKLCSYCYMRSKNVNYRCSLYKFINYVNLC